MWSFRPLPPTLLLGFVIFLALAAGLLAGEASGKVITMGGDAPFADVQDIQEAIDAANEGDEIHIQNGSYEFDRWSATPILVNKTLSLRGNGSHETFIRGFAESQSLFVISADWVNISGFSFESGYTSFRSWSAPGTCLEIMSSHNTIENNFFQGYSLALDVTNSHHNTIRNNTCQSCGSGMVFSNSNNDHIANNTCRNNGGSHYQYPVNAGYGMYFSGCKGNLLENNHCSYNTGSGIYFPADFSPVGSSPHDFNTFIQNTCLWNRKYGIYLGQSSGSLFLENNCSYNLESGIYVLGSNNSAFPGSNNSFIRNNCHRNGKPGLWVVADHCSFIRNRCMGNVREGLLLVGSGCRIEGNILKRNARGLLVSGRDCLVLENRFQKNVDSGATVEGRACQLENNSVVDNGKWGLWLEEPGCSLFGNVLEGNGLGLSSTVLWDPSFEPGEGNTVGGKEIRIYREERNLDVSGDVGQLYLVACRDVRIRGLEFVSVSRGLFATTCQDIVIEDCLFEENEEALTLEFSEKATIRDCHFQDNDQAIHFSASNNSLIQGNTIVDTSGWAISFQGSCWNHVENNTIVDTRAAIVNLYLSGLGLHSLNNTDHGNYVDTDGDQHPDGEDSFPSDPLAWAELDGDRVADYLDAFPLDPAASVDSDGDGFPDHWNARMNGNDSTSLPGLELDAFREDPAASRDSDGDGYPDSWNFGMGSRDSTTSLELDDFPLDPAASRDTDGDVGLIPGTGEKTGLTPQASLYLNWTSTPTTPGCGREIPGAGRRLG